MAKEEELDSRVRESTCKPSLGVTMVTILGGEWSQLFLPKMEGGGGRVI